MKRYRKKYHKPGQPTKKTFIDLEQMKKLYLSGWSDAQVAKFFDITQRTIDNWKQTDPKFFQSLKDWKLQADERVERSLYERACGYSHPEEVIFQYQGKIVRAKTIKIYPPDPTSMIFWLKNRQPDKWKDKTEVDHGLQDSLLEKYKDSNADDLLKAGRELAKAVLGDSRGDKAQEVSKPS